MNIKRLPESDTRFVPDLILHKCGDNSSNILMMEAKTEWYDEARHDLDKLRKVMDDREFTYRYGMFVIYGMNIPEIQILPPTYEKQS